MFSLYASAVATTVLQLKEVPPLVKEFEGQLALYGLEDGVDEVRIRNALEQYGTITKVEVGGWPPAIVYFTSHEAATKAAAMKPSVCKGQTTLYNELDYDKKGWYTLAVPWQ